MKSFFYKNSEWYWNGFFGFFFQPVGPTRKRERIIKEDHRLYDKLRIAAGYP